MFGFGSKTKKLEKKYAQLLEEAFQLSTSNRAKSDEKTAEAEKVRIQLEALKETE
ncbi:MAG: Lacal_2735 family protein [Mariniblastus sp.]